MLRLKLQYFGPLMQRVDSLEKTLMLGMLAKYSVGTDVSQELTSLLRERDLCELTELYVLLDAIGSQSHFGMCCEEGDTI